LFWVQAKLPAVDLHFSPSYTLNLGNALSHGDTPPTPAAHLPAKKRNTPHLRPHSMLRNAWPMTKVRPKFTTVLTAVPATRVSRG